MLLTIRASQHEHDRWFAAAGHRGFSRWARDAFEEKISREAHPPSPDPPVANGCHKHGIIGCIVCD